MEDDLLMSRIADGDQSAFNELYEAYSGRLLAWLNKQTRWDADDVAQETWVRVWKSASLYKPNQTFTAWMFTIAKRIVVDRIRRNKIGINQVFADEVEEFCEKFSYMSGGLEWMVDKEYRETAEIALTNLPRPQAEAFTLFVFAGLSCPDIAKKMGVSIATAKSRLRLARTAVREAVGRSQPIQDSTDKSRSMEVAYA